MRRDAAFTGLVVSVLFAAVCAYVLAHFSAGGGTLAVYAPDGDTGRAVSARSTQIMLTGVAVRRESVVSDPSSAAWSAEDGKRLPAGGAAAVFASGDVAQAARSAVFCADTDGYEYLSPFALEELSVDTVEALLASEPREYPGAAGRLVEGFEWYYAALADSGAKALECREYELTFDGSDASPVTARLIAADSSGTKTALLFRITAQDAALLHLRFCSAALTPRGE